MESYSPNGLRELARATLDYDRDRSDRMIAKAELKAALTPEMVIALVDRLDLVGDYIGKDCIPQEIPGRSGIMHAPLVIA